MEKQRFPSAGYVHNGFNLAEQNWGSGHWLLNDTIFHVFSDDFAQEELREQEYKLGGDVVYQISVEKLPFVGLDINGRIGQILPLTSVVYRYFSVPIFIS